MSAQLAWKALHEAGKARTPSSCPAFLPQTLVFWRQRSFDVALKPQRRYISWNPGSKKEIPVKKSGLRKLCMFLCPGVGIIRA